MVEIAGNNVALVNDVFSIEKDIADGELNGYISKIELEKGFSKQEAVNYTIDLVEREIQEFNTIYQQIKKRPVENQGLITYAEGLIDWMTGDIEWYNHTQRYIVEKAKQETKIEVPIKDNNW